MEPDEEMVKEINLDGEAVMVKPATPRERFTKIVGLLRQAEPLLTEATREMYKIPCRVTKYYGVDESDLPFSVRRIVAMTAMLSELLDKDASRE